MNETFSLESRTKTVLFAEGKNLRQSAWFSLRTTAYRLLLARSGVEALQRAHEFKGPIHVLLASLEMPDMTGIELAERLNQERPEMKVLFLAALRSGILVLSHGWHFLPAPFESEMLRDRVLDFVSEPQPATWENSPAEDTVSRLGKLTKREVQVLRLIAVGNSTKQVAAQLGIAFKTSVGHRSSLMKKLGIHDSVALVRYAIRAGLIDP